MYPTYIVPGGIGISEECVEDIVNIVLRLFAAEGLTYDQANLVLKRTGEALGANSEVMVDES